jgi:hypothetical protein
MGRPYFRSEVDPAERANYDASLAAVRDSLGEDTFDAAWAEGHEMTLERAVAYAREEDST